MNVQGSGWGGGARTGGSVPLPKKPRPFRYFPEKHETRSPFPPLDPEEANKILTSGPKRRGSSLDKDQRAEVVRLKRAGLSLNEVVEETGFSLGAVRGALRLEGVRTPEAHRRKLSDEQRAEVRRRQAAGEAMAALAREFGVSPATIANVVKKK